MSCGSWGRRSLSREYPFTRDGFSLTERRILAAVADRAAAAGMAFVRAAARETRPYLGDTRSFAMMDRTAHARIPFFHAEPADRQVDYESSCAWPTLGHGVLAGAADYVTLSDINWWVGGVHLRGHHVPWRWGDSTEHHTRGA